METAEGLCELAHCDDPFGNYLNEAHIGLALEAEDGPGIVP